MCAIYLWSARARAARMRWDRNCKILTADRNYKTMKQCLCYSFCASTFSSRLNNSYALSLFLSRVPGIIFPTFALHVCGTDDRTECAWDIHKNEREKFCHRYSKRISHVYVIYERFDWYNPERLYDTHAIVRKINLVIDVNYEFVNILFTHTHTDTQHGEIKYLSSHVC